MTLTPLAFDKSERTAGALRALIRGGLAMLSVVVSVNAAMAEEKIAIPTAIADFDNFDTSGEDSDRTARHAARVEAFASVLGDNLATGGKFEILESICPGSPCSASAVPPDDLVRAARQAGARILVYGGIHKVSTLLQWGMVQAVDLESDRVVLDRSFSFRGDTDEAFRRAATFIADYLEDVTLDP